MNKLQEYFEKIDKGCMEEIHLGMNHCGRKILLADNSSEIILCLKCRENKRGATEVLKIVEEIIDKWSIKNFNSDVPYLNRVNELKEQLKVHEEEINKK